MLNDRERLPYDAMGDYPPMELPPLADHSEMRAQRRSEARYEWTVIPAIRDIALAIGLVVAGYCLMRLGGL